jgi:hypothetical protein
MITAMGEENRCPACGPVADGNTSHYCPTHDRELTAECERYVAAWATNQVARIRSANVQNARAA